MYRGYTYEKIKNFIESESDSGCKLVSQEYLGSKKKIKIKCACGNIFVTTFNAFKHNSKTKCHNCMLSRKTDNQFKEEVFGLVGDEYIFLDKYIDYKTKLRCKHTFCGYVWDIVPSNFIRGNRCPQCLNKSRTKTNAQFISEVYDLVGDEYTFLDKYVKNNIKIRCLHNKCNHEYSVAPYNFLNGKRCPKCFADNRGKTKMIKNEEFLKRVFDTHGDDYEVLEKYKGIDKKILVRHNSNECNFSISNINTNNFLRGSGCHQCGIESSRLKRSKTHDMFIKEICNKYGKEYEVVGEYSGDKNKIEIRHNICNDTWLVTPSNILRGFGCPKCASSKGEKLIRSILNSYHIDFVEEYRFEDCRNERPLPFDFYLPKYSLIIEYDGEQHFEPVNFGGVSDERALDTHNSTVINDQIKNQYCKDNNIPLIRIPYWQFNKIEQILDKWLNKYGLIHSEDMKEIA